MAWVIAPCSGQETHKASYSTFYLSVTRMDISLSGMETNSQFWLKWKQVAGAHICCEVQEWMSLLPLWEEENKRRKQAQIHNSNTEKCIETFIFNEQKKEFELRKIYLWKGQEKEMDYHHSDWLKKINSIIISKHVSVSPGTKDNTEKLCPGLLFILIKKKVRSCVKDRSLFPFFALFASVVYWLTDWITAVEHCTCSMAHMAN